MINLELRHRCFEFMTLGKIEYDPARKGMKANTEHWAVINIDEGIGEYYRWQFFQQFKIQLEKPSWPIHSSVLKGYRDTDQDKPWGYRDLELVEMHYTHELFWNEQHVWLNSHCDAYHDLRQYYNVSSAMDKGHITIGRFRQKDIGILERFGRYSQN